MDQVFRVQVKHIREVPVLTLAPSSDVLERDQGSDNTLDPLTEGYALSGDQNIVQANMVAHYRIRDPAEWAFYGAPSEDIVRVEVTAAMVRSLGEMGVDRVLSDGREQLIATVSRRVQEGLDDAHSGLELSSLELTNLAPPAALASDFNEVQSSFIQAQTQQNEANAFAKSAIPQAQAEADQTVQAAHGDADSAQATADGDAKAFRALAAEYHQDPDVIRERLYREAVERAIDAAGSVRWIPPPSGGSYRGFRITIKLPAGTAGGTTPGDDEGP
jgi:membrane protease subunit HflK